ncbi:hypothetical protein, partial [Arthrobacter terricola]
MRAGLSRRLTENAQVTVSPENFLQALDVDITADPHSVKAHRSIPGYESLGIGAAAERLDAVAGLGIKGVAVRVIDRPVSGREEWRGRRDPWVSAIGTLVEEAAARHLTVVVDPFSAALQPTGQWGLLSDLEPADGGTLG